MDIDEENQRLKITYADGYQESFTYPGYGDNAVQRILINKLQVVELEVIFTGTGAVTEINFCPQCVVPESAHDVDHQCLFDNDMTLIPAQTIIAFENFESVEPLSKWTNGILETGEQAAFSTFLGRYGKGTDIPSRTFMVPPPSEAIGIHITLDFYEIDSWDGKRDRADVFIDGEQIELGQFSSRDDEGHREGRTPMGIVWSMDSETAPSNLGFGKQRDQKHRVKITVPSDTGLFDDGAIRLALAANLNNRIDNESAGWDNIKIVAIEKCENAGGILESMPILE